MKVETKTSRKRERKLHKEIKRLDITGCVGLGDLTLKLCRRGAILDARCFGSYVGGAG